MGTKNIIDSLPTEELLGAVVGRHKNFICAYLSADGKDVMKAVNGDYFTAVALSSILNNLILNNWNGELDMIRKITYGTIKRGDDDNANKA